ncbi:methyltransferase domain-containing protein [Chitinophaga sp. MM2321]|uniref:methyltransferase domain-containing protein n=1 Tax=Chitinophaga sp. MM2321 TaxID=3137178 RepID=UPI0032D58642
MPTTMPFLSGHADRWFRSDFQFHHLYPLYIQALAYKHWTPLEVARKAASFLATNAGVKILDIGSGAGKFCLSGAYYHPDASFYGIEQRDDLSLYATAAQQKLGLDNITFIHGNLTTLDLKDYDHFYFFNSFYEHLPGSFRIDDKLDFSTQLFNHYNGYMCQQLEKMPAGTRLATYHCPEEDAPAGYHVVGAHMDDLLKFWVKA